MADGMPRAYLRVDPNIDQHPDPLGMLLLLCAGARQADRGRFKDLGTVQRALGRSRAKALEARGDVEQLADGRWYIAGWDEWQEGDYTVAERMRRMRARRRKQRNAGVSGDTAPPSPRSIDVTTDAVERRNSSGSTSHGDRDEISPPPAEPGLRKHGTNPRAQGTNPRAQGTSPRQQRAAEKRGPWDAAGDILRRLKEAEGAA